MSVISSLRQLVKIRATCQVQNCLLNFSPVRNSRTELKVKWIRPQKVPSYLAIKSGDLSNFEMPDAESFRKYYDANEKLKNCSDENVRKLFSMGFQSNNCNYSAYKEALIGKVKAHKFDRKSDEVRIAQLTAEIRLKQYIWSLKTSNRKIRCAINELIHKRRRKIAKLRKTDYKKYEWLLEKLNLVYKPCPVVNDAVTRKKSVKLLAELRAKKLQEAKLGDYKKKLDEMKIPFLKKKLNKLLWIKEQETNLKLSPTVSESDIENLMKKIETVKLEIEERSKKGYIRKIHPFTLETYDPKESSTL